MPQNIQNFTVQKRRIQVQIEELGEKPTKRIQKKDRRRLLVLALAYDLILDSIVGFVIPILGDALTGLAGPKLFQYAFSRYGVEKSEYKKAGGSGTSTWMKQAADVVIGFIPILGDILDFFFASNFWWVRTTIKNVQETDQQKIKDYSAKRRELKQQLAAIERFERKFTRQNQDSIRSRRTGAMRNPRFSPQSPRGGRAPANNLRS